MKNTKQKTFFFESGRFYRQNATNAIYRCELARDIRTLLHLSSLKKWPHLPKRILLNGNSSHSEWALLSSDEEGPHQDSYSEDAFAEYGAEVGMQGIVFRRQYHFDPYLDVIGDVELKDRIALIADNIVRYDTKGAAQLITPAEGAHYWQRKLEEIVESLRITKREDFFRESQGRPDVRILNLNHDLRTKKEYKDNKPWGRIPSLPARVNEMALFKFGKKHYLQQAFLYGKLRIFPASFYSDPSLSAARQDSHELRLILRPSKNAYPITFEDIDGKNVWASNADHGQIAIEIGGDRDYFVWCCSKHYEPRMFVDFEADACLVIHDHKEFAHRLNAALCERAKFLPAMVADDVRYYDWLCTDEFIHEALTAKLPIHFFKDFRYTYQAEYRFTWPIPKKRSIEPIDVELGPLEDICDLLRL